MKSNYTKIAVVLDRSGSMANVKDATIEGFNSFLNDQKEVKGKCDVSLYQFDDKYETVYENRNIQDVPYLNNKTFVPRGWTALLDAIGRTVNKLGEQLSKMNEWDRPSKVIVIIQTDGHENKSKKFTHSQIFNMISHQKNKYNWQFIFLGANQDAIKTGESYGIGANTSLTYGASVTGTTMAFNAMSSNIASYRDGSNINADFSLKQRKEQEKEINN